MSKILMIIKTAFIVLAFGFLSKSYAGTNALSCDLKADQQYLGALPGFSHNSAPLQGFQCQHTPYYSSFLGNWFPSLPKLNISQTQQFLLKHDNSSSPSPSKQTNNDYNQSWELALVIKRVGRSQLSIFGGKKTWQQTLQAKDAIRFFPDNLSQASDSITINQRQQTRFNRNENTIGLSLIFPYQPTQKLTELRLQNTTIEQPIQADAPLFEKHSLFPASLNLNEILIVSQSHHRGFNTNWQFGLGTGEVILKPENIISVDSELNQVISLRGQLEFYYQLRINRHWFSHAGWKADIHYWQPMIKKDDYTLSSANTLSQQLFIGIGIHF